MDVGHLWNCRLKVCASRRMLLSALVRETFYVFLHWVVNGNSRDSELVNNREYITIGWPVINGTCITIDLTPREYCGKRNRKDGGDGGKVGCRMRKADVWAWHSCWSTELTDAWMTRTRSSPNWAYQHPVMKWGRAMGPSLSLKIYTQVTVDGWGKTLLQYCSCQ